MASPHELGFPPPLRDPLDRAGKIIIDNYNWQEFIRRQAKAFWSTAPASVGAAGTAGQIAYDSGFLYICVATNSWKRVAIASW